MNRESPPKHKADSEALAFLAAVVNCSDDAIIGRTPEGVITSWNRGAERMYGYPAGEVLGSHIELLAPPEGREELGGLLERTRNGEHIEHLETTQITRGGTCIRVSLTLCPILGPDGAVAGVSTIARDITETCRLQRLLAESEKRARAQLDQAPDAIVLLEEGRFVYANCAALGIYGATSLEEIQRFPFYDLVHPEERATVKERGRELLKGVEVPLHQCRLLRLDGQTVAVETSSVLIEYQGRPLIQVIARDISRRKRDEEERDRLLRELEFQRARFETVLQQMPIGVMTADAPTGALAYSNEASNRIFRAPFPEVKSLGDYGKWPVFRLDGTPLAVDDYPITRALFKGETVIGEELQIERGDQTRGFVSVNAALIRDTSGRIASAVAAFSDITDRLTGLRALRRSEERLSLALEAAGMGSCEMDLSSGTGVWSQQHFQLLGYDAPHGGGEATVAMWQDLILPQDLDGVKREFERARERGGLFRTEHRIIRVDDGRVVWVSVVGRFSYDPFCVAQSFLGVICDITEQKRAEEKLRSSEAKFRWLFESNLVAIFFWRKDGRITEANQAYCDLVGCSPDECRSGGLNWLDSTPPEQYDRDFSAAEDIISTGACRPYEKEFINRKDGRRVPVLIAGARMVGTESEGMGFAIDLTELKRTQEELHKQEQLMIRQARMAALGEMIGNIAHQWRQPLNTLALLVQELRWYYERGQFSQAYLDTNVARAMQVINHMSKTIDGFRNFYEPDKEKVPFRAADVLAQSISIVEAAFKELRLKIEVQADPDLVVLGCTNEFSQVILNLLFNAKDAILERDVAQPRVVVRLFRENEKAVLTVADNAGGIPDEIMERIFDPYFTTKGPDKGTGIGLFMSRTIIEKNMNGSLSARNTGEGVEFRVEVPL